MGMSKKKEEEKSHCLDKWTPVQAAFEKQKRWQMERILKKASKTHKDFNRHLDALTEHYDIPKDPTEEDLLRSCGNSTEMNPWFETLEEIDDFLQVFSDPYKEHVQAHPWPKPQLCVAETASGEGSQQGSRQSQVMPAWTATGMTSASCDVPGRVLTQNSAGAPEEDLDVILPELIEISEQNEQVMSCEHFSHTGGYQKTHVLDTPKTILTDCQKTNITASYMIHSKEGSTSGEQTLNSTQMTIFCGDQVKTLRDNQTLSVGQMTMPSGNQSLSAGQMTSFVNKQSFSGVQMTTSINKQMTISSGYPCGGWMAIASGSQSPSGNLMTTPSDDQNLSGGLMTVLRGNQSLSGDSMTVPCDKQSFSGGQMTTSVSNKGFPMGQMTTSLKNQSHSGTQMTVPNGHQIFYWGPLETLGSDQSFYLNLMTSRNNDQNLSGGHGMTLSNCQTLTGSYLRTTSQLLSSPHPGLLDFSGSPFIREQFLAKNWNLQTKSSPFLKKPASLKPYVCPHQDCGKCYSGSSHLRVHQRTHSGEKPYACNMKGCEWRFSRSEGLKRHMRRHTGERPYLCEICQKSFARSDHVSLHQSVHR
ncbi:Krueppel-like factor 1 [Fukomys damarensis]|uniref:Krueppel-like factor 1 n=1 Tax=Fukomys damarensis TaxID=885580 RepID=A0A091E5E4_FUKDA|nr:Krueppel-like factor 1 [Fukomys damarensis]